MKILYKREVSMQEKIVKEIVRIAEQKIGKKISDINEELLGNKISVKPVELAVLLTELEKEFHISFRSEDIVRGSFRTISDIALLIERQAL